MNATKFGKQTTREQLEMFFIQCGDYAPYVRFLFVKNGSTISAANDLLERVNAGDFTSMKIEAFEKGYGI